MLQVYRCGFVLPVQSFTGVSIADTTPRSAVSVEKKIDLYAVAGLSQMYSRCFVEVTPSVFAVNADGFITNRFNHTEPASLEIIEFKCDSANTIFDDSFSVGCSVLEATPLLSNDLPCMKAPPEVMVIQTWSVYQVHLYIRLVRAFNDDPESIHQKMIRRRLRL
ncbi:hypothetical protein K439DRAFT_1636062 [Ramaria rubella]|nr:hypothetical protein K439DRAFT_1636062 [Ramaria rubella]